MFMDIKVVARHKFLIQDLDVAHPHEIEVPEGSPQMAVADQVPGSHIVQEMVGIDRTALAGIVRRRKIGELNASVLQTRIKHRLDN
jgi:hypothetical protein